MESHARLQRSQMKRIFRLERYYTKVFISCDGVMKDQFDEICINKGRISAGQTTTKSSQDWSSWSKNQFSDSLLKTWSSWENRIGDKIKTRTVHAATRVLGCCHISIENRCSKFAWDPVGCSQLRHPICVIWSKLRKEKRKSPLPEPLIKANSNFLQLAQLETVATCMDTQNEQNVFQLQWHSHPHAFDDIVAMLSTIFSITQ